MTNATGGAGGAMYHSSNVKTLGNVWWVNYCDDERIPASKRYTVRARARALDGSLYHVVSGEGATQDEAMAAYNNRTVLPHERRDIIAAGYGWP